MAGIIGLMGLKKKEGKGAQYIVDRRKGYQIGDIRVMDFKIVAGAMRPLDDGEMPEVWFYPDREDGGYGSGPVVKVKNGSNIKFRYGDNWRTLKVQL
jgi:hypothetical protein